MAQLQTDANIAIIAKPLAAEIIKTWMCGAVERCHFSHYNNADELTHPSNIDLIVIGDLFNLPEFTGGNLLLTVKRLVGLTAGPPIAVFSDSEKYGLGLRCIQAGARGFIPTTSSLPVTISAMRLILNGGIYFPFELLAEIESPTDHHISAGAPSREPDRARFGTLQAGQLRQLGLSKRETQILELLQQGSGNKHIAETLGISDNTVMVHMRNLMRKLGATNRAQAVFKARQRLSAIPAQSAPA